MTIQSQLNDDAFSYIPKIVDLIREQSIFERNQIIERSLRAMLSTTISMSEMNAEELKKFENDLIETFKYQGWIK